MAYWLKHTVHIWIWHGVFLKDFFVIALKHAHMSGFVSFSVTVINMMMDRWECDWKQCKSAILNPLNNASKNAAFLWLSESVYNWFVQRNYLSDVGPKNPTNDDVL